MQSSTQGKNKKTKIHSVGVQQNFLLAGDANRCLDKVYAVSLIT